MKKETKQNVAKAIVALSLIPGLFVLYKVLQFVNLVKKPKVKENEN